MGRKAILSDDKMVELLEQFFIEKCEKNPSMIKIPAFAEYIRNSGYPDVKDYIVRRNEAVRERIEQLKESTEEEIIKSAVVFRNMDIDEFLAHKTSPATLKKALMERDEYYRHLSISANYCIKENKILEQKVISLEKENERITVEKETAEKELELCKKQVQELKDIQNKLRSFIDTYVYPEIANELLKQDGLIKETAGIVSTDVIENKLIDAGTDVKPKNHIIRGLFDNI